MKTPKIIFTIQDNIVKEWKVTPNKSLKGWSVLEEVPSDPTQTYVSIFPVTNEALKRDRLQSIKKSETYLGMDNLVFFTERETAEEVLELQKRFGKIVEEKDYGYNIKNNL
jgi:hypothetical protein